jgi:hypothetical protein
MRRKIISALLAGVTLATLISAGSAVRVRVPPLPELAGYPGVAGVAIFPDNAEQSTGTATTVLVPH